MTDQSDPDFSDDETTQTDASAPLVDYGNTPAEMTAETVETDMSTMPETRSAAQRTLAREVDEERRRRVPRDGSAPLRRSTSVRASAPEVIPCPDGIEGCEVPHLPPRQPAESRSLSSMPHGDVLPGPPTLVQAITGSVSHRGDMKAGLTSSRPKLSIVPAAGELYQCRAMEYGADKYRRGNYHGTPPAGVSSPARVVGYVDAAIRHLRAVADAYNRECATAAGPAALTYSDALGARDDVASGGFPASGLPHLAHAMASVALAIQCGVDDGLLPEDPGQPWKGGKVTEERSPEAATRFSHFGPAHADEGACAGPDGRCALPEALWHGYRRADVLAAYDREWDGLAPFSFRPGDQLSHKWNGNWRSIGGDTAWLSHEDILRWSGLRRPDEPDYKPLA